MKWFNKGKDFISPKDEIKESVGNSVKELFNGKTIADRVIRKNIRFIIFLAVLGIIYIANGYHTEKLYRKKINMEKEVRDLRFESITTASKLMHISKQSEVKKRIQDAGLDLQESKEPPIKIYRRR